MTAVREICLFSLFCAAAMSISPDGGAKRIMGAVCAAAMISILISPLKELDMRSYRVALSRYRQESDALLLSAEEGASKLERAVIESECEEYIKEKARQCGVKLDGAELETEMYDGMWLPYRVTLYGNYNARLAEIIETELGIPAMEQVWKNDG